MSSFDVGDKVVYPHHGAAVIERREKKEAFGEAREYLILKLAYGDLTLMVPSDNTDEVAAVVHLPTENQGLDASVQPRGYRLLHRIPRLPEGVHDSLVERFGNLQKIMRATIEELDDVAGVGTVRARAIKDGLARIAETSILDRFS